MAMLPSQFREDEHDDMGSFDALPAGDYNVKIVESSIELTKAAKEASNPNLGQYIKFKMEVLDGKQKGRGIYVNLNIINKNQQAVEIANKELATLCRAAGHKGVLKDTNEIHGKPFTVSLKQTGKESDPYGIQNAVKSYKAYAGPAVASGASTPKDESAKPAKKW